MPCLVSLVLPQDLTKQLDEVTQNSEIVEIRQKEAECELEAARDRVQQQATEILLKASKTLAPPLLSSPLLIFPPPQSLLASPPATTRLRFPHTQTHQTYPRGSPALVSGVVALDTLMALCCTSTLVSSSPRPLKGKSAKILLASLAVG